jgi:hypothetical protein
MPSVIQGFEYDIFITYRQNDNRSGWVTEFVNALTEELAATIKEPVSVHFDNNPHDGKPFRKIKDSEIFYGIIVLRNDFKSG